MGRRAKNELNALAKASRAQLKLAEDLNTSLKQRMHVKKTVAGAQGWIPDEDWRRDFASVTNTLQHAGNSLMRALEGNKKQNEGKTDEELMEQFVAQLLEVAPTLPEETWQALLIARSRKKNA
jgi:hypothetical protein